MLLVYKSVAFRNATLSGTQSFRILGKIAEGGMGTVVKAEDTATGRPVALKYIRADLSAASVGRELERFSKEARIGTLLDHPNVVKVFAYYDRFEYREQDSPQIYRCPCMVQELVPDGTFVDLLKTQSPIPEKIQVLIAALRGLEHIHAHGFVHRDIKPANILLKRADGRLIPKIADLGIAKEYTQAALDLLDEEQTGLTSANMVPGSPLYIAPEAFSEENSLHPANDIYAFGIILYQILNRGQGPCAESDSFAKIYKLKMAMAYPPLQGLSSAQQAVIDHALAATITDRFQSAGELIAALETAFELSSSPAPLLHASEIQAPLLAATRAVPDETTWVRQELAPPRPASAVPITPGNRVGRSIDRTLGMALNVGRQSASTVKTANLKIILTFLAVSICLLSAVLAVPAIVLALWFLQHNWNPQIFQDPPVEPTEQNTH